MPFMREPPLAIVATDIDAGGCKSDAAIEGAEPARNEARAASALAMPTLRSCFILHLMEPGS